MTVPDSLSTRITNKQPLTPYEVIGLVEILGERCRAKTKDRLRSVLTYGVTTLSNYYLYERVLFENFSDHNRVTYTAANSYPDEITALRNRLLNR